MINEKIQQHNEQLQNILDQINIWKPLINESPIEFIPTNSNINTTKSKVLDDNTDLLKLLYQVKLIDFEYIENEDGTFLLTGWKETYNGIPSNDLIIPIDSKIIL